MTDQPPDRATDTRATAADPPTTAWDIFRIFLGLGLTSFGGPVAHLGYFRTAFVARREWLSDAAYADLVALCQFLPGPASSQAGFAIGLMRGGWAGAAAAWAGFTLPSAIVLAAFGLGAGAITHPLGTGAIDGLKLLAVAVVAHALWGMGRSLAPDAARQAVALAALVLLAVWAGPPGQVAAILGGAVAGRVLSLGDASGAPGPADAMLAGRMPAPRTGAALIAVALGLLALLPVLTATGVGGQATALFEAFYRAGALVFGGGHVVLPLLEESVVAPGWVDAETFLAGYGAAQAVPGPLFTIAAYLGAAAEPAPAGMAGAAIALAAIFLPGLLLVAGALPWWDRLRGWAEARAALAGVNAAVVGVLASAFYDPVFTAGVAGPVDFAVAACAFFALQTGRAPVWAVVLAMAALGAARAVLGG